MKHRRLGTSSVNVVKHREAEPGAVTLTSRGRCPGLIITAVTQEDVTPTASSLTSEAASLLSLSSEAELQPLALRVQEEGAEPTAHVVIGQEPDIELRELESHRELVMQLVDNVQELEEDGCEAAVLARVVQIAPVIEPVAPHHPLLLYQGAETLQSPVEGVKAELS